MNGERKARLLALLVHRGLLDADTARAAHAAADPGALLVARGVVTPAQWEEWVRTEAGTRPQLTRYELGELIGEGGTARVFRASDRQSGEPIALKVLKPELSTPPAVERFVREAKLLLELRHDNVVRGLRVAREGSTFFLAMELIEGVCLQDQLAAEGPLDEELALQIVAQVARALAHLHERGLVHRDVKPGNVMLTEEGRAVLIDLGFATEPSGPGAAAPGDAATTSGTAYYISPEQARGQTDLDVRADIYSLGATLYHLVTGSLPFEGRTSEEIIAKQVLEALSGQRIRELGLSPQLHWFIEKMMAKEKEIRFQSPAHLVAEIQSYLDLLERERSAAAPAAAPPRRARRRRRGLP